MELEASDRRSHVHAWITLTGNRSKLPSMLVVEGDREQIQELFWSKQWKTDMVHARPLPQEVCVEFATGGSPASLAGPLSVYGEAAASVTRGARVLAPRPGRLRCEPTERRSPSSQTAPAPWMGLL